MKLYWQLLKLILRKFVLRRNTGLAVREFAEEMGVVYIKLAQILATQNYGKIFTEEDRAELSGICDECNPLEFAEIEVILQREYGNFEEVFEMIEPIPVGSASVSQVHRGVLKDGREVAIKIKRQDVTRTVTNDIERIRRLVHRFGKIIKLQNLAGGDRALDLYLKWIQQETDFRHEVENIKLYQKFAKSVNGKVLETRKIKVPEAYEEYCTENVIVMEFVRAQTINRMEMTKENKEQITLALNSYFKLSFWAMFHDRQIVFHGDPHGGNVCIDENGDIWFLDMGLLCVMNDEDAKLCRSLFLAAYTGNAQKLYELLVGYGKMSAGKSKQFRLSCEELCREVRGKEVTYYFVDMINECLDYEFVPPDFLFSMAKAFICLNGINKLVENQIAAQELLQEQTAEFMLRRSLNDCREILMAGVGLGPEMLTDTLQTGPIEAVAKIIAKSDLQRKLTSSVENFREMLELVSAK